MATERLTVARFPQMEPKARSVDAQPVAAVWPTMQAEFLVFTQPRPEPDTERPIAPARYQSFAT
jgi:hypothetical protein